LCQGQARYWNCRGFGFIIPEDKGEDIFCHFSAIKDGNCLREGDTVEYEVGYDDRRGKERAENVTGGYTEDRGFGDGDGDDRGGGGGGGGSRPVGECYDFRDGRSVMLAFALHPCLSTPPCKLCLSTLVFLCDIPVGAVVDRVVGSAMRVVSVVSVVVVTPFTLHTDPATHESAHRMTYTLPHTTGYDDRRDDCGGGRDCY
jgi:cold shock CspA family protein